MTTLHRTPSQLAMSFSLLSSDHLPDSYEATSINHSSTCSIPSSLTPSTRSSISSNNVTHTHIFIPSHQKYLSVDQCIEKKGFTTYVRWACGGPLPTVVTLEHGLIFGTRRILVNGTLMMSDRKLLDDGSIHHLSLHDHDVAVQIRTDKGAFHYSLSIDGQQAKQWQ